MTGANLPPGGQDAEEPEQRDFSIDFSVEELLALVRALGTGPVPGLDPEPLAAHTPDVREALLAAGHRALVARRILGFADEVGEAHAAVQALFTVVSSPGILVRAAHDVDGVTEVRFYYAVPDVAIEHSVVHGDVHRFAPFPTEDLLLHVLDFASLIERPTVDAEPLETTYAAVLDAIERLPDRHAAIGALASASADRPAAEAFLDALVTRACATAITLLYRPDASHVTGGELTWIDAGPKGLWLAPFLDEALHYRLPGDADHGPDDAVDEGEAVATPITVAPTTADAIAEELFSYLPAEGDAFVAEAGASRVAE